MFTRDNQTNEQQQGPEGKKDMCGGINKVSVWRTVGDGEGETETKGKEEGESRKVREDETRGREDAMRGEIKAGK